ncbi:MAG: hypothetical protein CSA75_01425, partial [Sorangium cellulosum]
QATVFVPAGDHEIEVRAPGYDHAFAEVSVQPSGNVTLTLTPVPAEQREDDDGGRSVRQIAGYSAIVAGGAFLAGGLYSSLKVNSANSDPAWTEYQEKVPKNQDICAVAKTGTPNVGKNGEVDNLCTSRKKFEVLQWVFYGLGAVAAGTGTYLLATGDAPEKKDDTAPRSARLQVIPSATYNRGGIDIRLVF